MPNLSTKDIIAVDIYLERRKTREYVGRLTHEREGNRRFFRLVFDKKYQQGRTSLPMGPELSLKKRVYESDTLFAAFVDRIPTRENPAYPDYCAYMGISLDETDPIVLLATIGKRGPSCFMFEPVYKKNFGADDLKEYRSSLGLTLREFAQLFDMSYSNLQKIESHQVSGKDILKRIEIYQKFPNVALYEVFKNAAVLHADKKTQVIKVLKNNFKQSN